MSARSSRDADNIYARAGQGLVSTGSGTVTTGAITYNNTINSVEPAASRPPTLRDSLAFKELQQREATIEDALAGTGQWFLESEEYRIWADSHKTQWKSALLWLRGNAGTGKSTIVKSTVDATRRAANSTDEIVLSHFFNARGSMLQQSAAGMYRTLLVWLLDKLPDEDEHLLEKEYGTYNDDTWAVPQLERLFKHAIKMTSDRSVVIFVDALDECIRADVRRLLRVFRDIVKEAWEMTPPRQVRVLFASRPHPTTTFDHAVFMDLDTQRSHFHDIVHYIDSNLRIGNDAKAIEVRQALVQKAGSLFMWAVWVVDTLNEDYDNGDVDLRQCIREIPTGLHRLYRYTLDLYPGERDELRACLRWVLFVKDEGFHAGQLWWAIQLSLGRNHHDISIEYRTRTAEDMCRYITRVSKGLVQTKLDRSYPKLISEPVEIDYRVEFSHESVQEFVATEVELQALYGIATYWEFAAQSHEHLRDMYFAELLGRYHAQDSILSDWRPCVPDPERKASNSHRGAEQFPFPMEFCAETMMIAHAEAAQEYGLEQTAFLRELDQRLGPFYRALPLVRYSELGMIVYGQLALLLYHRCQLLVRASQLGPAKRARASGAFWLFTDPGVIEAGQDWAADRLVSLFRALRPIVLQLEEWDPASLKLLSDITCSDTAHFALDSGSCGLGLPRRISIKSFSRSGLLLRLAEIAPSCASFFLLTSSSPLVLRSYFESFRGIFMSITHESPCSKDQAHAFLQTLLFFTLNNLDSNILDFSNTETRDLLAARMIEFRGHSNETYVCSRLLQIIVQKCCISQRTAEIIRKLYPHILFQLGTGLDLVEEEEAEDDFDDLYIMSGGKIAWGAC